MLNPHEILGILPSANKKEIKSAYRKKCREYHPDLNKDNPNALEMMKKVNGAYEVLSKRSQPSPEPNKPREQRQRASNGYQYGWGYASTTTASGASYGRTFIYIRL